MRNVHSRTWNMARNLKNVENEKHTLQDLDCGEKTKKREKCETHTVGHGKGRETMKNVKNEKCTLQDQKCGKKNGKGGK